MHHWGDCTYETKEEAVESWKKAGLDEKEIEQALQELTEYGVVEEWAHKGMFLTELEAEAHLRANRHHYSPDAHTYVDHAWRAPRMAAFFKALFEEFGIDPGGYR